MSREEVVAHAVFNAVGGNENAERGYRQVGEFVPLERSKGSAKPLTEKRLRNGSRPASPELRTREPYLLQIGIRIHRVFGPISETSAWIATESEIEWP